MMASAHPRIEQIADFCQRHHIVRDYVNVNLDIVWNTVLDDIPALIAEL